MRAAPETILLVEDDPGQAELIRLNLEIGNLPQYIVHVSDGRQALDYIDRCGDFQARAPCALLVLLDLRMPRVDGLEFLQQLRERSPAVQPPVLVFSGSDDPLLIARCYQLGCSLYFPKPSLFEEFIGTIERLAGLIQAVSVPAGL
jgi:CheY-like chemotaxis protein